MVEDVADGAEFPAGRGSAMTDDLARAWAYLSRVAEPPCPELRALVKRVGAVEAADRIQSGKADDRVAPHVEARRRIDCAAQDLELLARMGGRLVTPDDDEWPLLAFTAFSRGQRPAPSASQ